MAILSLLAKLGLDKTGFDAGMAAAGKQVVGFGKNLAASFGAAATAAAFLQLTRTALEYADATQELSERLETSIKSSQEWTLAAKLNGEEAGFVAANFQKMEQALNEANLSDAKAVRNLKALGISLTDIRNITVDEAMRKAAVTISQSGDEAAKSAAMMDIFSKSASKVKVVLRDLSTSQGLSHLFPTDQEIESLKETADALDSISQILKGFAVKIVNPLSTLLKPEGSKHSIEGMFSKAIAEGIKPGDEDKKGERARAVESFRRMERMRNVAGDIGKIQERIADKGMTDEQKMVQLVEQRARIMDQIAEIEAPGPKNPEQRQKAIRDLLKNEQEIIGLNPERPKESEKAIRSIPHIESTKLGAIGGTLGGAGIRADQLAAEQVRLTKDLKDILSRRGIVIATNGWR